MFITGMVFDVGGYKNKAGLFVNQVTIEQVSMNLAESINPHDLPAMGQSATVEVKIRMFDRNPSFTVVNVVKAPKA